MFPGSTSPPCDVRHDRRGREGAACFVPARIRPTFPPTMTDPFAGPRVVRAPDFPAGLDWLHTVDVRALALPDLRGRIALLDFWTYG